MNLITRMVSMENIWKKCYILTEPASLPARPLQCVECEREGMSGKESDRNGQLSLGRQVGQFERLFGKLVVSFVLKYELFITLGVHSIIVDFSVGQEGQT